MACGLVEVSSPALDFVVVVPKVMFDYFPDFCSTLRGSREGSSSLCGPFVCIAYIVLCVVVLLKVEGKGRRIAPGFLRRLCPSCSGLGVAAVV